MLEIPYTLAAELAGERFVAVKLRGGSTALALEGSAYNELDKGIAASVLCNDGYCHPKLIDSAATLDTINR